MAYDGNFKPYTFMLFEGWELAVQVSYSLNDETTLNREKCALVKFAKSYGVKTALIVTCDSLNAKIKHFLKFSDEDFKIK